MSDISEVITQPGVEAADIDPNDVIINEIQNKRLTIIKGILTDDPLVKNTDNQAFVIQLMNGAATTAMGNKKIKSAEKQAVNQAQIVHNLAEVVRMQMAAQAGTNRQNLKQNRVVPKLDPKIVPGNKDTGTIPISTTSIANGGNGLIS